MHRFGFGEAPRPDFAGESRGIWSARTRSTTAALASMSMGYQVGVTPLQMATAVSAVANGGLLMEPHVVRAIDARRSSRAVVEPKVAAARDHAGDRRDADDDHGRRRRARHGEERAARRAIRSPARPAPRSQDRRTAAIRRPTTTRRSSASCRRASRRSRFSSSSTRRSAGSHYGGAVAAPIFKRIAEAALQHAGVPPSINPIAADHRRRPPSCRRSRRTARARRRSAGR